MRINVLCVGTLGPILLTLAHRRGLFRKFGVDVQLIPVPGTQIPKLTIGNSLGHIGAPAAVMLAAEGTDLRILASFGTARLSSCLVVIPQINKPEQLRGKRLGARVTGAAMWLHTVLALQHLGLRPAEDRISIAEIGDSADIIRALEARQIDGAVLARAQCEQLSKKGYAILLDLFPLNIYGAPDALVVTTAFLRDHPEATEAIVAGLIEGAAVVQSPYNATSTRRVHRQQGDDSMSLTPPPITGVILAGGRAVACGKTSPYVARWFAPRRPCVEVMRSVFDDLDA